MLGSRRTIVQTIDKLACVYQPCMGTCLTCQTILAGLDLRCDDLRQQIKEINNLYLINVSMLAAMGERKKDKYTIVISRTMPLL